MLGNLSLAPRLIMPRGESALCAGKISYLVSDEEANRGRWRS
jgi:hypothetical protein